jgi:hypothetical protein
MAKTKKRDTLTHDQAMELARACLYSDYGMMIEILASLVILLLNERDNADDFIIPTRGERHAEWGRYMAEREGRENEAGR